MNRIFSEQILMNTVNWTVFHWKTRFYEEDYIEHDTTSGTIAPLIQL